MIKFVDESKLKKELDSYGLRYGDNMNTTHNYVCTFVDNKSGVVLSERLYKTPIAAVRDFNAVIEATKFPLDDITLQLNGVLIDSKKEYIPLEFELSPYLYFKKSSTSKK